MRRALCCLLMTLGGSSSVLAQTCVPPAQTEGPPVLHLAETATISVTPSLLVGDLTASADSPAALTAQRRVNDLMAKAAAAAGQQTGVALSYRDYSTSFIDRAAGVPAHWIASQSLELRGKDDEAVLGLVGQLQELGLTIGSLGWQVPQEALDAAGRHARLAALASLRQEAGEAASALGLVVDRYQAIDLSGGPRPVFGGPRPMMAAVAMAPPMATPDAQQVTATVTADVVLTRPRGFPDSNH